MKEWLKINSGAIINIINAILIWKFVWPRKKKGKDNEGKV